MLGLEGSPVFTWFFLKKYYIFSISSLIIYIISNQTIFFFLSIFYMIFLWIFKTIQVILDVFIYNFYRVSILFSQSILQLEFYFFKTLLKHNCITGTFYYYYYYYFLIKTCLRLCSTRNLSKDTVQGAKNKIKSTRPPSQQIFNQSNFIF